MIIDDKPKNRGELAEWLRTHVRTIEWVRKRLYALVDGCEELSKHCPVDDFFIWVMCRCFNNEFTEPSRSRKTRKKTRLLRKKLTKFIQEHPDHFTKATYLESLTHHRSYGTQPPIANPQRFFRPTEQINWPQRPQDFN